VKRIFFTAIFLVSLIPAVGAALVTEDMLYQQGEVVLNGYAAYDDSIEGQRPGILVVHEWWGHNDYARKRVEMLAEIGYIALAVDMYGDGKVADHPDTAGAFASEVSQQMEGIGRERFLKALEQLKNHPMTDPEKIAAIGYCFGGGVVLHMARYGLDLDGVVSFHGSLATDTPAQPGQVKARVLVCNGAEDTMITTETVEAFQQEMDSAQVDYKLIDYENATHSFTNPAADELGMKFGLPIAYNAAADQKSWQDMRDFFNELFLSKENPI
jgi:dienelactone hydrolase